MPNDRLTHLEESVITFAVQRYDRPLFRWGQYLGWLLAPLVALNFVPAAKPYALWINNAAILCMFAWYSVLVTRVIGKLAVRLNLSGVNLPKSQTRVSNETPKSSEARPSNKANMYDIPAAPWVVMVFVALLPVAAVVAIKEPGRPGSFLLSVCGNEIMLGCFAGLALMVASYPVYFTGHRPFGTLLFRIGFYVAVPCFAVGTLAGLVMLRYQHGG